MLKDASVHLSYKLPFLIPLTHDPTAASDGRSHPPTRPHPGTSSKELDWLISAQPRTKEDFVQFSDRLIEYIIKRHQGKPLYATFLEHHVRELAMPLRDVEVRKVASGLTTLANEKQKEQRDKAAGKKKPKTVAKPTLAAVKPSTRCVTFPAPPLFASNF